MRKKGAILIFILIASGLHAQVQDSVKPGILRQWTLSSDYTREVTLTFDTLFPLFHRYRATDKYSFFNAFTGNYGLPFYQINFFDRITDPDKYLYYYYYPLMYHHERFVFMNTRKPFTDLYWTFGGSREVAEQTFRVRHSQNINRFFNFGLVYDIVNSPGQYRYQQSNDNNFTFHTSYTGDRYKLYFAFGLNNIISGENGGVVDMNQLGSFETREVAVKLGGLNKAEGMLKNRSFLLVQRYSVNRNRTNGSDTVPVLESGSFRINGTFSHILQLENNRRTYSDNLPSSGFYDSIYISSERTFDSLYHRSLKNTLRFDFATDETRKFKLGGGAGIRNELIRYSQIIPVHDSTRADTAEWRRVNNSLVGRLYSDIGDKFSWNAEGELFLSGYRAGDFSLTGYITKSFDLKKGRAAWIITGGITSRQPSFWYEQWGGNHFEWKNNLNKEFRIDAGTTFSFPARTLNLKFNYAIIDNYTDFNSQAVPSQHTGGLSVAALMISKGIKAWKFHLDADLLLQRSSNKDILDLPLATARAAGYFDHLFIFRKTNGQLYVQTGFDVKIHTDYYAYAYMPATGRFYRQVSEQIGNYPFIDVFLNIKLKRTRIFLMVDHVNSGLTGYDYFLIPDYPLNIRMFRYGIAWTFYD